MRVVTRLCIAVAATMPMTATLVSLLLHNLLANYQLHVIEERFPGTLVQDTALACQNGWIQQVAAHPAVFGFFPKGGSGINPCTSALGIFRGMWKSWAPNVLLARVVRTLQSMFHDRCGFFSFSLQASSPCVVDVWVCCLGLSVSVYICLCLCLSVCFSFFLPPALSGKTFSCVYGSLRRQQL